MYIKKTEEDLKDQTDKIWEFLQYIHPELGNKNYLNQLNGVCAIGDLAIELRALKRVKGESATYCNHRVYNYSDRQKEKLCEFFKKLNNKEIPYCLYYSVFNFNSKIMGVSQSGNLKQSWNNCVCLNNAVATHILVMDFDNLTEEEFIKHRAKLANIALDTTDIFSGHGYQCIIKLNQLCLDKDILKKLTNTLLQKGFKVDPKIKDSARLMRLSDTDNCKDIPKGGEAIPTELCYKSAKEYSVEDVFNRLDTLPTIITIEEPTKASKAIKVDLIDEPTLIKKEAIKEVKMENKEINKNRLTDIELENLYPMLNIKDMSEPVKLMLSGFQPKRANSMLIFLVRYFKSLEYSDLIITKIVEKLKDLDTYNYSWNDLDLSEVDRFYKMDDYDVVGTYVGLKLDEFGYLGDVNYVLYDKEIIRIENYVFNHLHEISSQAFCHYVKLLQFKHNEGKSVFTMKEMAEITGVSVRSLKTHIDKLIDIKLIDKKRANRRMNEEYIYFINKVKRNQELGYTKFNINLLWRLLKMVEFKEINQTQLMICMFFKYKCYSSEYNCYLSQDTISVNLGLTQSAISKAFKDIEKAGLIKRTKEEISDFQFKYHYNINF